MTIFEFCAIIAAAIVLVVATVAFAIGFRFGRSKRPGPSPGPVVAGKRTEGGTRGPGRRSP